jgi:hypothetical protein
MNDKVVRICKEAAFAYSEPRNPNWDDLIRSEFWTSEICPQRYHYTNPLGCSTSRGARS